MNGKLTLSIALGAVLSLSAVSAVAQDTASTNTQTGSAQNFSVANGKKFKFRGIVTNRQANTLTVRDEKTGNNVQVLIADTTKIKSKQFYGAGNSYAGNLITQGLALRIEGRGDASGALSATEINIDKDDLRVAQSLEARVNPVEGRVGEAETRITQGEQNAQRLSGQLDELVAISNSARGGAQAAQETADAAVSGVNATNSRITSLDEYAAQTEASINFKVGSAVLSPEAKTQLDQIAQSAQSTRGYVMEVTGFADSTGSSAKNRALSERRAESVIRYLVENGNVPLRRILPSYGFGEIETKAVADNKTRDGRAQNRRVEVKLLVSRGLTQAVEVRQGAAATDSTTTPDSTTTTPTPDSTTQPQPQATPQQ